MKTLRYIVLALIFLLLVVAVAGFFLPSKVHLQRSIEISRDKTTIFKVINAFENFNHWSPWYELDVNAQYRVSGPKFGVGSKLEWHGNEKVGDGVNEIIESVDNQYIKNKMYFGKSDAPAYAIISLKEKGDVTEVTWAFENDFGMNVFYRYFGLVIEDMIAPDYEKGLKKLKIYVESLPLYDYSSISKVTTRSQKVYTLQSNSTNQSQDITAAITKAYTQLVEFINTNKLQMAGTPKIINLDTNDKFYIFKAAIPVQNNEIVDANDAIKGEVMYAGKALKMIHKGSYDDFKKSYDVLQAYMTQNGIIGNGNSWEDFVTDPGQVSIENLITHIYQPIE